MRNFKPGDKVVKNPETWEASDFDRWGAGEGVGVVISNEAGVVDVQWTAGRAYQRFWELKLAEESDHAAS